MLAAGIGVAWLTEAHPEHPAATSTETTTAPPSTAPSSTARRAAIRGGRMVVDRKPFFPILSWGECIDDFRTSLPVGVNVYVANRCGGLEAQLAALRGRALSAALAGERVPRPRDVIGVFYPDEPDGHGMTAATLPDVAAGTGVRFMTLTNHFYSGAAPLAAGRSIYPALVARADMVGFDLYPLQNWCRPDRLVDVYLAQRELVELARGRPTYQWIEAAGMTCPHAGPTEVTPATVEAESWLAVAGGARGLGFFPPAAWTGDVGGAIARVTGTVRSLGPALLAPDARVAVTPPDGLVKAGARAYHGELLVVVANAGYEEATATITVDSLNGRRLREIRSGRTVTPDGDTFAETFAPLETRIYVTGGL